MHHCQHHTSAQISLPNFETGAFTGLATHLPVQLVSANFCLDAGTASKLAQFQIRTHSMKVKILTTAVQNTVLSPVMTLCTVPPCSHFAEQGECKSAGLTPWSHQHTSETIHTTHSYLMYVLNFVLSLLSAHSVACSSHARPWNGAYQCSPSSLSG